MKGTVEAVKESKQFQTQKGAACHVGVKVDGNWYQLQFCRPGVPVCVSGDFVEFDYTPVQNGEYTNNVINRESLTVTKNPREGGSAGARRQMNANGPTIGMAINNAVACGGRVYQDILSMSKLFMRVSEELTRWADAGMPEDPVLGNEPPGPGGGGGGGHAVAPGPGGGGGGHAVAPGPGGGYGYGYADQPLGVTPQDW